MSPYARHVGVLALASLAGCSTKTNTPATTTPSAVDVQVLALSSFLGQLDPLEDTASDGGTANFGGLGALSAYFQADRAKNPNSILLMTADSFGASPPLSALFKDEPAVKGMNFLGATADTFGNHNFNNGIPYLDHLMDVATFPYVIANMNDVASELQGKAVTPYKIVTVAGMQIALVGIIDPNAPTKTFPGLFGSIVITEPVAAANAAATNARAAGANAVIVMTDLESTGVDLSGAQNGVLIDFASAVQGVDLVLGYRASAPAAVHTSGTLVVENEWKGRTYTRATLHFANGVLGGIDAEVVEPDTSFVTPDPAAETLLAPYRAQLAAAYDSPIAVASGILPRDGSERKVEVAIGDLIADAYLDKYKPVHAQMAIMNSGGIRDSLPSAYAPKATTLRRPGAGYAAGPPFDIVQGDVYTVLPFGDHCIVRPITGVTLWAMLENAVFLSPTTATRFLQIAGFKFTYKVSAPPGARVQSVTLDDGTPIASGDTKSYTLVLPDIINAGSDSYGMLKEAIPSSPRDVEADVLLAYIKKQAQLTPAVAGRITAVP